MGARERSWTGQDIVAMGTLRATTPRTPCGIGVSRLGRRPEAPRPKRHPDAVAAPRYRGPLVVSR